MPKSSKIDYNLKIGMWNIQGLSEEKINSDLFVNFVSKMHIISFVETWCDSGKPHYDIPGFVCICNSNRIKHKKARRNSGGVNLYVRNSLSKGVTKLSSNHKDIIWTKLDKNFFNLKKDTYIGTVYFSPENSLNNVEDLNERFSKLLANIEHYSQLGDILIQGDFNAYTNTVPDFVMSDDTDLPKSNDKQYIIDNQMYRNNLDKKATNKSGKLLLELCKESSLRIMNGRTLGDLPGNYTCLTYNGCSVVDYSIASLDLFKSVGNFQVHDFTPISDHCPISCSLFTCFKSSCINNCKSKLDPLPGKFIWNEEAINNYTKNIQSPKVKQKINDFMISEQRDCETATTQLNTILYDTALSSAKFIKSRSKINNKKPRKPWFSESCHDLRVTVVKYCWLVNKHPDNGTYRKAYYSFRSKYRRLCKQEEKKYKNQIYDQIFHNIKNDPKTFWNLINKLSSLSENKKEENFNEDEFITFFTEMYSGNTQNNNFHDQIILKFRDKLKELDSIKEDHILNNEISKEEILKAVKTLKNGKAAGTDFISNEMIKSGIPILVNPLHKLFNLVFQSGTFPEIWNISYISLIYKKGDKSNPNNYRGISVTSNLGKLFNKIIHNRLYTFIDSNKLISKNQIGFKPKARTADHIFSLKSIIDYYKSKKKKVFAAFIDLRKAFDTVWREGLFYILLKYKIPNKLFYIIYSMYQNTTCRIKFPNGLSQYFPSFCGVKQGDVLSPTLFNLFINGLSDDLNNDTTDPIVIGDVKVTSLLYADDIILLSESQEGLQNALNILNNFCVSWKLDVNKKKSKILIFNSNGKSHINHFKIENEILETVKSYCYLGIIINYTGNLNISKTNLMEKGRKAWFKIKKTLSLDNPICILEKLFDTLVVPIILYGSEVWGAVKIYRDTDPYENLHLKFIKEILGVHSKATNIACLAETNRTPLHLKVQINILKFLVHILNSPDSLVSNIYHNVRESSLWVSHLKDSLNKLGFSHLNYNLTNIQFYIRRIKERLYDQNKQNMNSSLAASEKLSFFRKVHLPSKRPAYIDICNKTERSVLSRFRISAHTLAIERGRYRNIERNRRLCLSCNNGEVEDEYHFFSTCPHYAPQRKKFIEQLRKYCSLSFKNPYFTHNEILLLLKSNSSNILKTTVKYMKECLQLRIDA